MHRRCSRLKKYNRCHDMGGWAVNSQSLKCYLQAFAYVQALPPLSRDLLHERKISQAFLLTSFVLHGITWSTSRIGNVLHAVKVLHEIAQSNTANKLHTRASVKNCRCRFHRVTVTLTRPHWHDPTDSVSQSVSWVPDSLSLSDCVSSKPVKCVVCWLPSSNFQDQDQDRRRKRRHHY